MKQVDGTMYKKPLISILTPVYNQSLYIRRTIHSVLNQTCKDWEWIILDDGSTDGTGDIIRNYQDRRIKYVFQEHAGINQLTRTRNKALSMCNGELIATLDSDDYWPEYNLEVHVKGFEDPDVVLSYGECCVVTPDGKKISYIGIPKDPNMAYNDPVSSFLKRVINMGSLIPPSVIMLRQRTLLKIGGFLEEDGVPWDSPIFPMFCLEGKFAAIPMCLGYWRRHASSTNLKRDQEQLFDAVIAFLRKFLIQNKKKLDDLGFYFNMESIERDWEEKRRAHIKFLPYNTAMLFLRLGLFEEARAEFKKFKEESPSLKNRLIYLLIALSELINLDIVNPASTLREKAGKVIKAG